MATTDIYFKKLKDLKKGDTYLGAEITLDITPAIDLTGATINMWLRKDKKDNPKVALKLSTTNSELTITAPTIFQINEQKIPVNAGFYYYDMEVTFASGRVKTYVEGTWLITEDISG